MIPKAKNRSNRCHQGLRLWGIFPGLGVRLQLRQGEDEDCREIMSEQVKFIWDIPPQYDQKGKRLWGR